MSSSSPYLIMLKGGPTYDLDDHFAYHAEILSPAFEGEIWTFGPHEAVKTVGRIQIRCVKVKAPSGIAAFREYLQIVAASIVSRKAALSSRKVTIVTYEPFVQPLIGYWLARKIGGKLVIEFPGTYKDKHNFADVSSKWHRRMKYGRQKILAQLSVWLSDAVRVHFPGQNDGFVTVPSKKPTSFYFDAIRLDRFKATTVKPEKYVLFVGSPYFRKGTDTLVAAWHQLAPRFPEWKLVLIGHELDIHMSEADLSCSQIEYVKPMNNSKVAPYIKGCSILAVPSRSDTMPRVLMEAGAAGRPRIMTRVGGMPYMMEEETEGLFVPPENPTALSDKLAALMEDEGLREQIGRAGFESVHQRFSGTRYREDLLQCVEMLHPSTVDIEVAI